MIYTIPKKNLKELTKKINRVKKNDIEVVFNILKEHVVEVKIEPGIVIAVTCVDVEVEGKYQLDDWSFVAVIQHDEVGNIMRCANSDLESKIPERYFTAPQACEHCNRQLNRKDTYLVYNHEDKEFKQVGKNCLMNYTNGLDTEKGKFLLLGIHRYIDQLRSDLENGYHYNSSWNDKSSYELKSSEIKQLLFTYIKNNGYQRGMHDVLFKLVF